MGIICLNNISIIIPVKDNPNGIEKLLNSFFSTQNPIHYPKEIIIVDNLSKNKLSINPSYLNKGVPIHIIKCDRIGPAAARNDGAKLASGEWLFFTDSDCILTEHSLTGFLNTINNGVAYAGTVIPYNNNFITRFYTKINLLNAPPDEMKPLQPSHIITANCLIQTNAFLNSGGFDEKFKLASGEDVDLGLLLKKNGNLYYAKDAVVKHLFENNLMEFFKRFHRYGTSIPQLEKKHSIKINWKKTISGDLKLTDKLLAFILKFAVNKGIKNYVNKVRHTD